MKILNWLLISVFLITHASCAGGSKSRDVVADEKLGLSAEAEDFEEERDAFVQRRIDERQRELQRQATEPNL